MSILEQVVDTATVAAVALVGEEEYVCQCNRRAVVLLGTNPKTMAELAQALAPTDENRRAWQEALGQAREGEEAQLTLPRPSRSSGTQEELKVVVAPWCPGMKPPPLVVLLRCEAEEERIRSREAHLVRLTAVGQLAAGAGRELNDLLTTIMGWTQIALRPPTREEKLQSALSIIEEHCTRAKELIGDVVGLSRHQRRQPHELILADAADQVIKLLDWDFRQAGVIIKRNYQAVPAVLADRSRLFHALLNLVTNAVQSMPEGGELSVATSVADQMVRLEFHDTGPGMDAETMAQVFEPHFSTRPYTGIFAGGAGMGLTISRRLVEGEEGVIEVDSEPGRGTRFTVALPAAPAGHLRASQQLGNWERLPSGLEILVVESQTDLRKMLRAALEQQDQIVTTAANGIEALAVCRRRRFDLALLDASMPGAQGPVLAEKLRELGPNMKIFLVCGDMSSPQQTDGIDGLLHKPFSVKELCRALHGVGQEVPAANSAAE